MSPWRCGLCIHDTARHLAVPYQFGTGANCVRPLQASLRQAWFSGSGPYTFPSKSVIILGVRLEIRSSGRSTTWWRLSKILLRRSRAGGVARTVRISHVLVVAPQFERMLRAFFEQHIESRHSVGARACPQWLSCCVGTGCSHPLVSTPPPRPHHAAMAMQSFHLGGRPRTRKGRDRSGNPRGDRRRCRDAGHQPRVLLSLV